MPIDILQLVPFRPEVQKELAARYRLHQLDSLGEAAGVIRGIVTNGHSGPGAELIDRLPKLEIIASASVGYDTIAVEHARARGIPVTNTPDVLNNDVADLAIALILMTARRATALPIRPSPTIPSRLPPALSPSGNSPARHLPARTNASAATSRRAVIRISAMARSATSLLRTSGVLVTGMPRARACSTAMVS